jgi:hypothetical protein
VLRGERPGQRDRAEAGREVSPMQRAHLHEVLSERRSRRLRQRRHAILVALRPAQTQLARLEVDVLHAQRESLEQAQSRPIEQSRYQPLHARELREQRAHLLTREHDRQPQRRVRANRARDVADVELQHLAIQEHERAERLILRRRRDAPFDGKVRQEAPNRVPSELARVTLAVIEHIPADPANVGLDRTRTAMTDAKCIAHAIEKPRRPPAPCRLHLDSSRAGRRGKAQGERANPTARAPRPQPSPRAPSELCSGRERAGASSEAVPRRGGSRERCSAVFAEQNYTATGGDGRCPI